MARSPPCPLGCGCRSWCLLGSEMSRMEAAPGSTLHKNDTFQCSLSPLHMPISEPHEVSRSCDFELRMATRSCVNQPRHRPYSYQCAACLPFQLSSNHAKHQITGIQRRQDAPMQQPSIDGKGRCSVTTKDG